jgi:ATP-binding cassette subfamily B protein
MTLASLFMFAAPLLGKYAIDVAVQKDINLGLPILVMPLQSWLTADPFIQYLGLSAVATVIATAIGGVFHYLRGRLAAVASEGIVRNVRAGLYWRLHHISAEFFDRADTGDLVQRCSSDVETLRTFLSTDTVEIGRAIILLLTVIPILFYLHAPLAWVSLALMPILVIFAYFFFLKVKEVFLKTDEAEAHMTTVLQENLAGIRVVRAFSRQEYETRKFGERNREFRDYNNQLIRVMGLYWGISDFVAMLQVGMVLFAGAYWAMRGDITIGTLFAFMTYEAMVIWPVRHLGRVLTNTGKATVSLERINEIMTQATESEDSVPNHDRADGALSIRDVTFAYDPDMIILRNLSVEIKAGESVAFVGPPGSGKSTLIRLLLRLYSAQSGAIELDGVDIQSINRKWLRSQIGVVLQNPFLYSRTIAENLMVGSNNAVQTHVQRACIDAAIHDSVSGFPLGYQTRVGERGVTLSGGQRQRLALARALLKDPAILVLDDSLSAVDTGTEKHILRALARRHGRHTTITIAHRLSSVVSADRIFVLDKGAVVQVGSHEELAGRDGPYRDLCRVQEVMESRIEQDLNHASEDSA